MSRTLPRAEGARPGKFVSRSTVIAGADDTDFFSPDREARIVAQRGVKSKRTTVDFCWKNSAEGRRATCEGKNKSREDQNKKGRSGSAPSDREIMRGGLSGGCCGRGGLAMSWRRRLFAFPADADDFGDAWFLHGDAVENAAGFHRFAIVSDDDELRLRAHFADQASEAPDIGLIERSIDFVQDTERTRLIAKDGDEQRERGHGLFAAGEKQDILKPLSWR